MDVTVMALFPIPFPLLQLACNMLGGYGMVASRICSAWGLHDILGPICAKLLLHGVQGELEGPEPRGVESQ